MRRLRERPSGADIPLFVLDAWAERFPWLVHGTTGRGPDGDFDLGLSGETPVGTSMARWRALREATGMLRAVHGLQVHDRRVARHDDDPGPGEPGSGSGSGGDPVPRELRILHGVDGHVTDRPGTLLTVTVADCVPISLVDPDRRRVALLHGGWRGTAAGMVAAGLEALGGEPRSLHAHLGPAICGDCYEVGPEVHTALGLPAPAGNTPVDVRAVQARQLVDAGVPAGQLSVSEHCTLCGTGFFSHRGGSPGRQLGVLGIAPGP
jgi:polyphenol oxidase